MRFTGTGEVEVFDGRSWRPLASLMGDSGMREDFPVTSEPASGSESEPEPDSGSETRRPQGAAAVGGEQEPPGLLA